MHESLDSLITQYQNAAKKLFPKVAKHLNIELPITNIKWAKMDTAQRGKTSDGIKYFIHGYGIAMNDNNVVIDLDLGDEGQIDGFDPYRLICFAEDNNINIPWKNLKEIELEIKKAEADGELIYSGYILYYRKIRNDNGSLVERNL